MCGIFAYLNYAKPVTRQHIINALIGGLRRLEYRGYDSAGIAISNEAGTAPEIFRMKGNVDQLEDLLKNTGLDHEKVLTTHVGIAHTRWATHGEPCIRNSHPQRSDDQNGFVVVHNGIITNYADIKLTLTRAGFVFESDTDTEVIVKLAKFLYDAHRNSGRTPTFPLLVAEVCKVVQGAYAIVMMSKHYPGEAICVKVSSPLILGVKSRSAETMKRVSSAPRSVSSSQMRVAAEAQQDGLVDELAEAAITDNRPSTGPRPIEFFLASDVSAIVEHTRQVMYLEDHDMIHFVDGHYHLYNHRTSDDLPENRVLQNLEIELDKISKGNFSHYMLKEIYEQEETVMSTMRGRVDFEKCEVKLGGLQANIDHIRKSRKLTFVACGTSYHSAVACRGIVEELTRLTVTVELASDFLDRRPPVFRDDCCVFISQSGETADTLRALEYCKSHQALCVGITNTVGSAIARGTDCGVYLNCGPEIGVASTKAYTSQIIAILLIALQVGSDLISNRARREAIIRALKTLPIQVSLVLKLDSKMKEIAERLHKQKSLLIMGRGYQYATCLEAALKIKEIPYIHCEAVLAGELKHGPLALIDDTMPIIFIATKDALLEKSKNALSQIQARSGKPTIFCTEGDISFTDAENVVRLPSTVDCLQGLLNIIPLQLLSFHMALLKGLNVDQPRNLAKSVTVE